MIRSEAREILPVNYVLNSIKDVYLPHPIDAKIFMDMQYDNYMDIWDHNGPDKKDTPWPLLLVSPKEDLARVDPLDFRLDQYVENKVYELFGIPFHELIQFPRRDFLKVINSAKKHSARSIDIGSSELKKLEKTLKG